METKQVTEQLKAFYQGLSRGRKITFLAVIVGSTLSILALILIAGQVDYSLLYANLTPQDAGLITSQLKAMKLPYKLEGDGSMILVPVEHVHEARLQLASEGLPQGGGVGYELFDRRNLGVTEFVQRLNYRRAIEGELSRTISQLAEVPRARVHITIPEKTLFMDEEEARPKASVTLSLLGGRSLSQGQVRGIAHIVSSSVEGLSIEDVTIIDDHGRLLTRKEEELIAGRPTGTLLKYKQQYERNLEKKVQGMLERVVGPDNAIVQVAANLNFDQFEQTEEKYDPEATAVRSEQLTMEKSSGAGPTPMGVPGTASNLPEGETGVPGSSGAKSASEKRNETINYEVNRIVNRTVKPVGTLTKLSVAVLIDGTYKSSETASETEGEETVSEYVPRTEEEMSQFEEIVKSAVGYSTKRGDQIEVANIPFEVEEVIEVEPTGINWRDILPFARYVVILIALVILFFAVIRPLINWMMTPPVDEEAAELAPGSPEMLEGMEALELEAPKEDYRVKIIAEIQEHPEQVLETIKGMLAEA